MKKKDVMKKKKLLKHVRKNNRMKRHHNFIVKTLKRADLIGKLADMSGKEEVKK